MNNDIAVAHKDYEVRGGGETVAEELAKTFNCPLYVGNEIRENLPDNWTLPLHPLNLSSLQQMMIRWGGVPRSIAYMTAWRMGTDELTQYETVILSGNEPLWYRSTDRQTVIVYTHAPPRWLTDLWHRDDHHGMTGQLRGVLRIVQSALFQHNVLQPDHFIACSDLVARRMRKYWNIPEHQLDVCYPGVDVDSFSPDRGATEEFYLYLGRLNKNKRVDLLVDVFNQLPGDQFNLKIAGKGQMFEELSQHAGPNIEMLGYVDERKKRILFSQAKAVLFPSLNEDFGIVPVEAFASGTPVLGVDDGFTRYQIQEGLNGRLFHRSVQSLKQTLRDFESQGVEWSPQTISTFADQFSLNRFREEMRTIVDRVRNQTRINPEFDQPESEAISPS